MNITLETVKESMQKLEKDKWSKGVIMQIVKHSKPEVYDEYIKEKKKLACERTMKWMQDNKEKAREMRKNWKHQEYVCECGRKITNGTKSSHLKTEYHKRHMTRT